MKLQLAISLILAMLLSMNAFGMNMSATPNSTSGDIFFQKANVVFLKSTQTVRDLSDRHLDRLIEFRADSIQISCSDIKDIMSQFSTQIEVLNQDLKGQGAVETEVRKSLEQKFQHLQILSQESLKQCSEPDVNWTLDLIRQELMNTGFAVQSYRWKNSTQP